MNSINPNYPAKVKKDRRDLAFSWEDPTQEPDLSYATVDRWENGQDKPSKLPGLSWMRFLNGCRKQKC